MVELSYGDIRERLNRVVVAVTTAGINVFTTVFGAPVPDYKTRYIVRLEAAGTGATLQALQVLSTGSVGSPLTPPWNVANGGNLDEPSDYNIENALIRIPGGQDVQLKASIAGLTAALLYYDDEVH